MDPNGQMESAVINPHRFIECIELHFNEYVKELRAVTSTPAKEKFLAAVAFKWRLGTPGHQIGLTKEQFLGGA